MYVCNANITIWDVIAFGIQAILYIFDSLCTPFAPFLAGSNAASL